MGKVSALTILFLVGCASPPPWTYATDAAGRVYPAECRHDLGAETKDVGVLPMPRRELTARVEALTGVTFTNGTTVNGFTRQVAGATVIWIADDLSGWRYEDTLFHERVHVCMAALHGGDGQWHAVEGVK